MPETPQSLYPARSQSWWAENAQKRAGGASQPWGVILDIYLSLETHHFCSSPKEKASISRCSMPACRSSRKLSQEAIRTIPSEWPCNKRHFLLKSWNHLSDGWAA